jgi:Uma2 family endonuclease
MSTTLRLTLAKFDRMVADGAFDSLRDRRIELLHGELRSRSPPGPDHSNAVSRLTGWSAAAMLKKLAAVRVQDPVAIPELDSQPQPDLAWVQVRSYSDRHPLPAEVLLLIEVADSSLDFDCGEKAELYAAAGIQDYWVVSLPERLVHIYRRPTDGAYADHRTAGRGEEIAPLADPRYKLSVAELLGP